MRKMSSKTALKILDLPLKEDNGAGEKTVKGYLKRLLMSVVQDQEGFSGKRPFGNSGWMSELHWALIKGGVIKGTIDEDGYIESCDDDVAKIKIQQAIEYMCASEGDRMSKFQTTRASKHYVTDTGVPIVKHKDGSWSAYYNEKGGL